MREQDPKKRIKNFNEVPYGYDEEEAVAEASRCLQCPNAPCVEGCPAEIDIPGFINAIKERRFLDALAIIRKTNSLPAVCGRVCPQEDQCELKCVLMKTGNPINIGALERFAADFEKKLDQKLKTESQVQEDKPKVAVIGSGPAGLTCAADLGLSSFASMSRAKDFPLPCTTPTAKKGRLRWCARRWE